MRVRFSFLALAVLVGVGSQSWAANIAIIDSGVDYKHKDLASVMWTNPESETKTKDAVYKDDTHGWNFAENNNQIIDYKYLGTFSADCSKLFEVQGKILQGKATDEEKKWYADKKADTTFLKEVGTFGNFVHGTHVSGIASHNSPKTELIGIKLIPTASPLGNVTAWMNEATQSYANTNQSDGIRDYLAKFLLGKLAQQQVKILSSISVYVAATKGEVANGSFGTSVSAVSAVIAPLLKVILGHDLTDQEKKDYGSYFINQIVENSKPFLAASPDTLFVFAAGNDGTDNDTLPTWPANAKADNSIAVAASNGVSGLASFSNYGATNVEVAAPGVVITSTIPGDQYLALSGTSMAAPYVTNVAGLIKDSNRALKVTEVKRILLETVDTKDFLKGKVTTSGIVNRARAVRAAALSLEMPLDQAISRSRSDVADATPTLRELTNAGMDLSNLIVLPLPNPLF